MAETLPPMTIEQLRNALENPHFRSYVYIGNETDVGWRMAIAAQKILPALRVYRVAMSMAKVVRSEFTVPDICVGIIFGWTTDIKRTLAAAEAEDFLTLTEAIAKNPLWECV